MSPVLGTVTVPSSCPVGESSRTSTVASLSPAFAADTVKVLLRDLSRASSKETQLPSAAAWMDVPRSREVSTRSIPEYWSKFCAGVVADRSRGGIRSPATCRTLDLRMSADDAPTMMSYALVSTTHVSRVTSQCCLLY